VVEYSNLLLFVTSGNLFSTLNSHKTFKSNVKIGKDVLLERAKQELLKKAKLSRKEPGGL
jgi:hypothetical protein